MRYRPVLFLAILSFTSIVGQARVGLASNADSSVTESVTEAPGNVQSIRKHTSNDRATQRIQLASQAEITRLPPPITPAPDPKLDVKPAVQIESKLAPKLAPKAVETAKKTTTTGQPPMRPSLRETLRPKNEMVSRASAVVNEQQAELPLQLFQPDLTERTNGQAAARPQRPTRVESLDFERPRKIVAPAANDHERLAAENLRVSPLSGVHDFEQSMDVLGMEDEPASDAPLTEAERSSLSLSAEVRTQANRMLIRAEQLANRGAVFAAKDEFVRALRMVTRSLDAEIGRSYHSRCLARGLQALEEADDFTSQSKCVETDTDLHGFIAGHQTDVLHDSDTTTLTPLIAMRHYYDYAHDQLTKAGAQSPVASKSLFAVGKAHSRIQKAPTEGEGAPKSLAFYNAALAVDPNNAQAANELAVLLAQTGHLDHAASVLQRSAQVAPSSIGLQNLAHIYQQMGQVGAAQQVTTTHQHLSATPGSLTPTAGQPHQQIMWVSPQAFNQTASAIDETPGAPKSIQPATIAGQSANVPAKRLSERPNNGSSNRSSHWW